MGVKMRNLDLGPISVQVTEQVDTPLPDVLADKSRAADARRFQALMNRHRQQRDGRGEDRVPPEAFLGVLPEPDAGDVADTDDIGSEIAHLWIGTGLRSSREVRVGLRESLLPSTQLRLHEVEDRLRVEFTCATAGVAAWLERKLPVLARELGERLGRDVEIVVRMANGHHVCSTNWPEGARDLAAGAGARQ